MFDLDVREQGRVAQVGLPARADVVPVVWLVSAPPPAPRRLVRMLETGWEHYILYPKPPSIYLYPLPKMQSHQLAHQKADLTPRWRADMMGCGGVWLVKKVRRETGGVREEERGQWVQCKV